MCIVTFRVLRMIVLVATKCAANAVAQKCKVLSHPSKCILICGCKYQNKAHHVLSRVWTHPLLRQVRYETQGSTQLDGKPQPQCKPSASRHDATAEERKKMRPKTLSWVLLVSPLVEKFVRLQFFACTCCDRYQNHACKWKKLQFLGCSYIAPISARFKLTTLLLGGLVNLIVWYCSFGWQWRQL